MVPHAPKIVLTGIGHFFPETVLDNAFFDGLDIGSAAGWIDERVGIRERRSVLAREDIVRLRRGEVTHRQLVEAGRVMTAAKMCVEPWRLATERAGLSNGAFQPEQVICGTSVPDWDIPANACAIAAELGLECAAFDVNSACSSFVINLHVARCLLQTGSVRSAAIFTPERYTTRMDYTDRASCVLFGDAATAAIVETEGSHQPAGKTLQGLELIDTIVRSSPAGFMNVKIPDGGTFSQDGKAVQKFAVTKTVAVFHELIQRHGLRQDQVGYFIGHQANFRMLSSSCQKNGLRDDQHLYNVDSRGNQGAAGAPAVLSTNWTKLKAGDYLVMAVVGSGLTWGAALLRRI